MKTNLREDMNPESNCTELDLDSLESVVGGGLSVNYTATSYGSATFVSYNGEGQYVEL
jgi:hypothetical protein